MPEEATKEVDANAMLKQALQDSHIRWIHLRSIEARLQDEIDGLENSWWVPKHAQKAAILESAKALVAKVMSDSKEEQERFKEEEGGEIGE